MRKIKLLPLLVFVSLLLDGCILPAGPTEARYVYTIQPAPPFISEEVALAKARETMVHEGYDLEQWKPTTADNPTNQAPDGRSDHWLIRSNPHCGRVHFSNGSQTRTYDVSLEGDRVLCSLSRGF